MSQDLREALSDIFAKCCDVMKDKLDSNPEDITAADLNAIRGFLKDNGITAVPAEGSPLGKLADKVRELDSRDFPFAVPASSLLEADDPAVLRTEVS